MLYAIVFLIFLELGFRFIYGMKRKFSLLAPDTWCLKWAKHTAFESHPYISYVKKSNVHSTRYPSNEFGYANPKSMLFENKKVLRIYVLGGSTVEQNDFDQEQPFNPEVTWPFLLQEMLNKKKLIYPIEVINAGCSGYTSIESLIEFQLRGIFFKPDFAIFYHGINDAWLSQSVSGFKKDYTHIRGVVQFPKINKWPDIRIFFLYQYLLFRFTNLHKPSALLPYLVKSLPYHSDLIITQEKINVFKNNVRSFCAICAANGIIPVLIPWEFPDKDLSSPYGHSFSDEMLQKFMDLLNHNNNALYEVSKEFKNAIFLRRANFPRENFRAKDWIHFNKKGLYEMASHVSNSLIPHLQEFKQKNFQKVFSPNEVV